MMGAAFLAVADLLEKYETSTESWHCAAIAGHTKSMQLTHPEKQQLKEEGILTVGQLLALGDTANITNVVDRARIQPITWPNQWLRTKLMALMNRVVQQ